MNIDIGALPLILCGPILRRVGSHSVSVFLALKEHRWVQLKLYENANTFNGNVFIDDPIKWEPNFEYELQPTVALGEHLYVVVATARIPTTNAQGQAIEGLVPGKNYAYNVFFHSTNADTGESISLAQTSFGLMTNNAAHRIGYDPGFLPTFSIAPEDFGRLNIWHGSCRKPHGEGTDMLRFVDKMIEKNRTSPYDRPHLLLLTGDQIYADDVSPTLLKVLHDTANALLGWTETFPGTGYSTPPMLAQLASIRAAAQAADAQKDQQSLTNLKAALEAASQSAAGVKSWSSNLLISKLMMRQMDLYQQEIEDDLEKFGDRQPADNHKVVTQWAQKVLVWQQNIEEIVSELRSDRNWGQAAAVKSVENKNLLKGLKAEVGNMLTAITNMNNDDQQALVQMLNQLAAELDLNSNVNEYNGFVVRGRVEYYARQVAGLQSVQNKTRAALTDLLEEMDAWLALSTVNGKPDLFTYIASRISPPQRANELKQYASLTSDEMIAHLMFLGEFFMMYLFTWSDALWPRSADGAILLPPFYEAVPNYGMMGALSPTSLRKDQEELVKFANGLSQVRRVLANVPVMMTFDDHEVTDDWNLNLDWVKNVNGSVMGPQVLRNALAAHAIFQDWGNQPEDYQEARLGQQLLTYLTYPGQGVRPPMAVDNSNEQKAVSRLFGVGPEVAQQLPTVLTLSSTVNAVVGVVNESQTTNDKAYGVVLPAGRKRWDWVYQPRATSIFKVIALDTRTHRAYPTEQWAARISLPLDSSLQAGGFVAPASLIQPQEMQVQLGNRLSSQVVNLVVSPAPVYGMPFVEEFAQRAQVLTSGPEVADFEAWIGNPDGFRRFFDTVKGGGGTSYQVVLLSGDVHYGYSNRLAMHGPGSSVMQLCSSSMKNEAMMTRTLGYAGRDSYLRRLTEGGNFDFTLEELKGSLEELWEGVENTGENASNFFTWLDETAPMMNILDPGSYTSYFLALKDTQLFKFNLLMPRGMVTVGSELYGYLFEDMKNQDSSQPQGNQALGGAEVEFMTDTRSRDQRLAAAATLNGYQADEVADLLKTMKDGEIKLTQMSETVGFCNVARVSFRSGVSARQNAGTRHELFWFTHDRRGKPEQFLSSTVHEWPLVQQGAAQLLSFQQELALIALQQYNRWNPPTGAIKESTEAGRAILEEYWTVLMTKNAALKAAGAFNRTVNGKEILDVAFGSPYDDKGNIKAWSAAFISYVVNKAGGGDDFFYSPRHIDYVRFAKAQKVNTTDNAFYLYELTEFAPQVGDILVTWRETQYSYQDIETQHLMAMRPSHCDIVVEVTNANVTAIGGNLSDTVRKTTYDLTNGKLDPTANSPLIGLIRARRNP